MMTERFAPAVSSRTASLTPTTPDVTGMLRSAPGRAWSTIGVAAATIAPWLALCLITFLLRTVALSLLRERMRRPRSNALS
jgi:hypothetical protein